MKNRALTNLEFGRMGNNRALAGLEFGSLPDNRALSSLEFNTGNNISTPRKGGKIVFKKVIKLRNGKLGMFFVFESGEKLILPFEEDKKNGY